MRKLQRNLDNSTVSDVSANNEDPFTEGLKSLECVSILMNCMQSLEKQVGQIFKMLEKTEDLQIKGECQLSDTSIKPRPVIVKFAQYSIREKVFKSKKTQG